MSRPPRALPSGTSDKPSLPSPPPSATPAVEPASPVVAAPATVRVGKYDAALTELVRQGSGVTVAEAAEQIGVHPTALYPIIRRLEAQGAVVKLGRRLEVPQAAGVEQLWCEEGHTWARPTVRGRKPKRCPAHR